jgi:hypothetical protein
MGLIAWAYLSRRDRTPWDFIGEKDVLCARRDCLYHGSRGRIANRNEPTTADLARYFHLDDGDLGFVAARRRSQ